MHQRAAEYDALLFPTEATFFGCLLRLDDDRPVEFSASLADRVLSVGAGELTVRVFLSPHAGSLGLHDVDPRTRPLLQAPSTTIFPWQDR